MNTRDIIRLNNSFSLKRNYESGFQRDGGRSVLFNVIKKSRGLLRKDSHVDTGHEENEVLKSIITTQKASLCPLYKILDKDNGTLVIKYLYSLLEDESKIQTFGFISRGDVDLVIKNLAKESFAPESIPKNEEFTPSESTESMESVETKEHARLKGPLISSVKIFNSDSAKFSNHAIVLRGTLESERKDLIMNKKRIKWFLRNCVDGGKQEYTSILNTFMNARPTHSFESTRNISVLLVNPIVLAHDIIISRHFLILDDT
ncbi:hypothetical protein BEWA_013130 [Theileria equi strain WA]|uniref:Uncharacterized protein n=1 Tax=Theileria equi strain WA TaxID=1537102 RepID=L1LBW5_THEEQ|nr:hypothetical protein BEWA_013130 [Theileria equi strain WA]EKX72754.1 hypothetical protein BEWA_013130 [Theileria equi strain WA]|eukprot:XP_004832206.1 hypothetical protein BEWA_013130 [Theileria equi strain WA]